MPIWMRSGSNDEMFAGALSTLTDLVFKATPCRWPHEDERTAFAQHCDDLSRCFSTDAAHTHQEIDYAIDALDAVLRNGYRCEEADELLTLASRFRAAVDRVDVDAFIAVARDAATAIREARAGV
jgi:hypothetical protein